MLSGWCARQNLGPFLRLSLRNPTRVFSCEETPQTSQQRPSPEDGCASAESALDFIRAIGAHSPLVKALRVFAWRLTRGAVSSSNVYIVAHLTLKYKLFEWISSLI
jgi:hypothetical protein